MKIFVVKISRIEQNPRKPQNFHPLKLIRYTICENVYMQYKQVIIIIMFFDLGLGRHWNLSRVL